MEEKTTEKVSAPSRGRIGGASIAWVTLYGALCGVTGLVPIFPYVGGGGYVPLTTPFCAIAPLLLGPWGGVIAAIVGGVIGMFIAPAAYPLQVVDIFLNAVLPALFVALMLKDDRLWKVTVPLFIIIGIVGWLVPFYIPGGAGGFGRVPEPLYFIMAALYWVPSTIIAVTPLGTRLIPKWVLSKNRVERYGGIFLAVLAAMFIWWLPWTRPYWYLFNFSADHPRSLLLVGAGAFRYHCGHHYPHYRGPGTQRIAKDRRRYLVNRDPPFPESHYLTPSPQLPSPLRFGEGRGAQG